MNPTIRNSCSALTVLVLIFAVGCGGPPDTAYEATVTEEMAPPTAPEASIEAGENEAGTGARMFILTDDTEIEFTGYKLVGSHTGSFLMYDGTIDLRGPTPAGAQFRVEIDLDSVMTQDDTLTEVLKGNQFFNVNVNPISTFESTKVEREDDTFWVTGNLELCGMTKSLRFPMAIELADDQLTATAEFTVKRQTWGMTWDGIGENIMKDDVLIRLSVVAEPKS